MTCDSWFHDAAWADACCAVRFTLCTDAESGSLPRIAQILARRDITPERLTARRLGDNLHVDIILRGVAPEETHLVHGNLCQLVGMQSLRREDMVMAKARAA